MNTRDPLDVADLGRRIFDRRIAMNLDQDGVARRARLSRAYISRLERGVVPNPKLTEVARVAEALDLSLVELIRKPPGTRTERYSLECAELTQQLAQAPPEVADTILGWWRDTMKILRVHPLAREN